MPVITAESENTYGGQAWAENNQEVFLKPRKLFRDPFRGGDHLLVLCDSFLPPQVRLTWVEARADWTAASTQESAHEVQH